jgi:hypothetical protein
MLGTVGSKLSTNVSAPKSGSILVLAVALEFAELATEALVAEALTTEELIEVELEITELAFDDRERLTADELDAVELITDTATEEFIVSKLAELRLADLDEAKLFTLDNALLASAVLDGATLLATDALVEFAIGAEELLLLSAPPPHALSTKLIAKNTIPFR